MTNALRADLFNRVDRIASVLADDVDAAERNRRLPATTVDAMRSARLLWLKVPTVLGGFEAEPALQFEVFERVAYTSAVAAWCLFIYADNAGMVSSRLGDEGLAAYLDSDGDVPVSAGGGGLRPGTLRRAKGGYELSGDWRYGSGIDAAEWVMVSGLLPPETNTKDPRPKAQVLQCVVARRDLQIKDNWHVHGLAGTGSSDYSARDVYVPESLTFSPFGPPQRGGRQYRTAVAGYLSYTIPAVAHGACRRSIDDLLKSAGSIKRGYTQPRALADSTVFQHFVGQADQRLRAAKALMLANGEALMEAVDAQGRATPAQEADTRAAAAYATKVAADVMHEMTRLAGGSAVQLGHRFERALRDVTMASTHLLVGESAFENHGQFLLGLPGADPMA